jgi:hypothetical protein
MVGHHFNKFDPNEQGKNEIPAIAGCVYAAADLHPAVMYLKHCNG